MACRSWLASFGAAAVFAHTAIACEVSIENPLVYAASPAARAAALYMEISNHCDSNEKLVKVTSEAAARLALHGTETGSDGVATMHSIDNGLEVPANGSLVLQPGGLHVMLMGLAEIPRQDQVLEFRLQFDTSGEISIKAPVTLTRP